MQENPQYPNLHIIGHWIDVVLEENKVQNHPISFDLKVNLEAMMLSMTYHNVIVTNKNLYLITAHDFKILRD